MRMRGLAATALAAGLMLAVTGCKTEGAASAAQSGLASVSIGTAGGQRDFQVERARTAAEQERGLMFRTDIPKNGGMLFAPYPADGGPPREASFWMKNTPTSLDIIFIRPDGTIARIAENTVPFSEAPVASGEPVSAVLELVGGRAAELGIAEGDKVTLPK